MKKPEYYQQKPVIDYFEVIKYIEEKYRIDTRDYYRKFSNESGCHDYIPYCDYWHYLIDNIIFEVTNGCTVILPVGQLTQEENEYTDHTPEWVKEISQLIYDEFGEDEMNVYISW